MQIKIRTLQQKEYLLQVVSSWTIEQTISFLIKQENLAPNYQYRFIYNGKTLTPTDTLLHLGISDNDVCVLFAKLDPNYKPEPKQEPKQEPEQKEDEIEKIVELGFKRENVVEIYAMCQEDVEKTVALLFELYDI